MTVLCLIVLVFAVAKCWRFFIETSDDIRQIRLLEPWFWFVVFNLSLCLISSNYDYQYIVIGLLIQVALCVWFAISMTWIIHSCHHKTAVINHSWFVKGKSVKFCHRCGTRLPKESHADVVKDESWQNYLFQLPAHLLEYVFFWAANSGMLLIVVFLVLKML